MRVSKFILYLVSFLFLSGNVNALEYVFFSPSTDCENEIIRLINQSQDKIDIAVYAINNDNIINALKQAKNRGVKIRILTDRLQASNKSSKAKELYAFGFDIKVNFQYKIEHNKFALFDNNYVSSGSYNWTNPATSANSENCIFFEDNQPIIQAYQKHFNQLWQLNNKAKSDEWFNRHPTTNKEES